MDLGTTTNPSWPDLIATNMLFADKKINSVVLIGAGNVATCFSLALKNAGYTIRQVFSRSQQHAQTLANRLACNYTTQIADITPDADIYVFSVKDDALPELIAGMPSNDGLWIHTAGSVPMDIFHGYATHYGVFYPLQTISKQRITDFANVPLFIEGNTPENENAIRQVAEQLLRNATRKPQYTSERQTIVAEQRLRNTTRYGDKPDSVDGSTKQLTENITVLSSEKRKYLHLAAVFACNFTNHMYALAAGILEEQQIDWHVLQPLIDETAQKLHSLSPAEAQTGPAVRYDQCVMERHLALLANERLRELYRLISKSIHNESTHNESTFH